MEFEVALATMLLTRKQISHFNGSFVNTPSVGIRWRYFYFEIQFYADMIKNRPMNQEDVDYFKRLSPEWEMH
jgi:hypothetical protein